MAKNIVVCCDGTGNQLGEDNSNVIKVYQVLSRDAEKQIAYYHPGVGTMGAKSALSTAGKWWTRVRGLAFGYGLSDNIADAYEFLMHNYKPGDIVYVFGFSRGAYTARALCGLLQLVGLLFPGNEGQIPYAIRLFKSRRSDKFRIADSFRSTFCNPCRPYFVGVWDTVSSVGWILDPIGLKPGSLPFTFKLSDVSIVRHAVSIDERRAFFRQNLVQESPGHNVLQVWFAGVHSDVGGSYPEGEDGLSKITLRWMLREAKSAGLLLNDAVVSQLLGGDPAYTKPCFQAMQHNSLTPAWYIGEFWPKRHMKQEPSAPGDQPKFKAIIRPNLFARRTIPDGVRIHDSVVQRQNTVPSYKPRNLPKQYSVEPEPVGYPEYPVHLEVGQPLVAGIYARPKWNDTSVLVKQGETYRLSATGHWFDASIKAGPGGYKSPNWWFRLLEGLRRISRADWFALVVTIGQDLSTAIVPVPKADAQPATLNVAQDGILHAFANDLSWFYGNNSGHVLLTIARVA